MLLVCEGRITEKEYFESLRHETRNPLLVVQVVGDGESPKTVVEHAVRLQKDAARQAWAAKDENLLYNEVWCVFDRDEHPRIPEALQQAGDNGIQVAFSNPCFELWLLLHFQEQRKALSRAEAAKHLRVFIPRYEKAVPFGRVYPLYRDAVRRAAELAEWQTKRGCARENPFTDVYILTERILALGQSTRPFGQP
jgi:hypothetical protein